MARKHSRSRARASASAETFRTAELSLTERFAWLRQAGITFDGARDLYEAFGYPRTLTHKQYREAYARGGIAGRIVDLFPKATWRKSQDKLDGRVYEVENPEATTPFETSWMSLENRLRVWSTFEALDTLAGLGQYSCLFIGVEDTGSVETELPKGGGKTEKVLFLTPFSDADAKVSEWEQDPRNPRFGLPKFYQLGRTNFTASDLTKKVHYTRILHVAETTLDNEVSGFPRLERVWNLLLDLEKVTGGGAEAFWLRANQGLHLDMTENLPPAEIARLQDEVDKYKHNMNRVLKTKKIGVKTLGSDVANLGDPVDTILTQIAGSIGIPKRMLTGSEMGQLASGQDRNNWDTQVADRRTNYAGPRIVRTFVDRLLKFGYLPPVKEYHIQWPPQQSLTETETAEYAEKLAAINKHFPSRTVIQPNEVRELVGLEALPELEIDLDAEQEQRVQENEQQVARLEAAMRRGEDVSLVVSR